MKNVIKKSEARALWIKSQGLDQAAPFGKGPAATTKAVEHLGYVQIDTISVIERSHHHILFSRIPTYKIEDLHQAQTTDKTVFEYWTHALAYVPTKDFKFFMPKMQKSKLSPSSWFDSVTKDDMKKVLSQIKKDGAISIRDINDDVLVEKEHAWGSRKPSKKAMQLGFNNGQLVISERVGMLKKYELTDRHFGWAKKPKAATEKELVDYRIDRALRSQGLVSLESICHLIPSQKAETKANIEKRIKENKLIEIQIENESKTQHWITPELYETKKPKIEQDRVHILSPFDPLVIQRKRLELFFGYDHKFEAYVPKEKRKMGYFALPILIEDRIVAAIDLKTDRESQELLIQKWTWIGKEKSTENKKLIEKELERFEKFQLRK